MKFLTMVAALIALGDAATAPAPAPGSEYEEGFALAKSSIKRVKRRTVCSPSKACALRVTGTKLSGLPPLTDRESDCSSFMTVTETAAEETTTVPFPISTPPPLSSLAPLVRRQQQSSSAAPTAGASVPTYAADFCSAPLYSAICSSWGFTPTTITVTPTVTVTESPLPTVTTFSGVLQVNDANTGASLGYVAPDPNYWTPLLSSDINAALVINFDILSDSTLATDVNFATSDSRGTYFAPVSGRDNANDDIAPGSFHYLYLTPTSGTAPAGSPPQLIPNLFTTSTGLTKGSETAVWSVNLVTNAVTAQWINTDGSPAAATVLFVQSNHLYGGGNPAAFQARFPSPVTTVTLTWVPL